MAGLTPRWLQNVVRVRAARRWARLAGEADGLPASRLRRLDAQARDLRRDLNRIISQADARLDRMRPGADPVDLPAGTDWRWRPGFLSAPIEPSGIAAPDSGTRLGDEAAVWHDCADRALILRQVRNAGHAELSPYGLLLETLGFSGSFLSLSVDLPPDALQGLTRSHILRLAIGVSVERPMNIYGRLNIGHGPNTDDLLRHLGDVVAGQAQHLVCEFDLHLVEMNEKRLEKIWLDLIFEIAPHECRADRGYVPVASHAGRGVGMPMGTTFTSAGLRGGIWRGMLHRATPPGRVVLAQNGTTVARADVSTAENGAYHVSVRLPADLLTDGVQTFLLLADDGDGDDAPRPGAERLAQLPVVAGRALDGDLRAEIELLRAELDLVKREVRRLAGG